jgi:hypothetical protein
MKKGKYIDYNILLACLSQKPVAKNNTVKQGVETITDPKRIMIFSPASPSLRVA